MDLELADLAGGWALLLMKLYKISYSVDAIFASMIYCLG